MISRAPFWFPALLILSAPSLAVAAQVDFAKNSVRTGSTGRAAAGTPLVVGEGLTTGRDARAQISMGRKGSVMRAGSKTEAVLRDDTTLSLRQGILLASSGRGALGREGIAIDTPETKTTVRGTMLVAYQPETYIKITCIEGEVTVRLKALLGEFVSLREGQMVIINPAEKRLPESVEVDLRELIRTSALMGPEFPALASAARLDRATERQARVVDRGDVIPTPLILSGAGLTVSLQTESGQTAQREASAPPPAPAAPLPPRPTPPRPPAGGGTVDPPPPLREYIIDGTTLFTAGAFPTLQTPGLPVIEGFSASSAETTVWHFLDQDPNIGPELLIRGQVFIPASAEPGDAYVVGGELAIGDGSATVIEHDGSLSFSAGGPIGIHAARITNAGESHTNLALVSGTSVAMAGSMIEQRAGIQVTAPTISVDQTTLDSSAGPISLVSTGAGGGITISNSSDLRSLATSVGLAIVSNGGPVSVRDSQLSASQIVIDSFDPSADTLVELRNATLNGDFIRARGFNSADRDALIINNSTVNGAQMIKFYAEGASRLRFQGNVDLNLSSGGLAVLAGRTVQVDEGGAVRVRGDAEVYRDVDNYNKSGFGTISATGKVVDLPHGRRPPF